MKSTKQITVTAEVHSLLADYARRHCQKIGALSNLILEDFLRRNNKPKASKLAG